MTKHSKSENSPDLLYNFFRPRLRRGPKKLFGPIVVPTCPATADSACTGQLECRSCGSMDLGEAVENGLSECIAQRIELGDGVNALYESTTSNLVEFRPLHLAVIGKYRETIASRYESIVKMLVEQFQADIDSVDSDGNTPLQKAIQKDDVDMVELLISLGANVNLRQAKTMVTTLKLAENSAEISLILTSYGATGCFLKI